MVYVCAVCMHIFMQVCVPTHASGGQRGRSGTIHYLTLPHFFETGSLSEPGARLVAIILLKSFCSPQDPNIKNWGNKHGMWPCLAPYIHIGIQILWLYSKCSWPLIHISNPTIHVCPLYMFRSVALSYSNRKQTKRLLVVEGCSEKTDCHSQQPGKLARPGWHCPPPSPPGWT